MSRKKYTKPRAVRLGDIDSDIEKYMSESGIKFPELVKMVLSDFLKNDGPKRLTNLTELKEEIRQFRIEFSRTGGNLNQLARNFNTTHQVDKNKLAEVHQELRLKFNDVIDILDRIVQILER